jgi:hypothetical protein
MYARGDRERNLCEKAARVDWLYLSAAGLTAVGAVWLNGETKFAPSLPVRFAGPAAIGLSVGWLIGALPLALPQCSETGMRFGGREGDVRSNFFLATSVALGSAALASVTMAIATGQQPQEWGTVERAGRVATTAAFAFGGALLPYVLPPKTWRAAEELRRLRFEAGSESAFVSYTTSF